MSNASAIAGDAAVGRFVPADTARPAFNRLPPSTIERLLRVPGLSATVSDVLDELGWRLVVPRHVLAPRNTRRTTVVGHALTLGYLPCRAEMSRESTRSPGARLAHHTVFDLATPGDVLVISSGADVTCSAFGGIAAAGAVAAGLAGCIIDGAARDLDQIQDARLPIWTRSITPRTGKWRLEAMSINRPVACGGVQVHAGDLVVADETGVCFVPPEACDAAIERVLRVAAEEAESMGKSAPP